MPAIIDVLLPVFNAESTVASSLSSILNQSLRDIRVIVVNDGSTDRTGAVLDDLAKSDPRVTLISTPNRGIVCALNTALAQSSASYVARHDADDIAFEGRLSAQLDFLTQHPDIVAVGCNAWHIGDDGRRLGSCTEFEPQLSGDPYRVPSLEPYILHPFLMARRDAVMKAGAYRHVFHAEDVDLYWRLGRLGKLHNLVEMLGEYRMHAGSISSASLSNGRVMAVYSQLAALSERRRREGYEDLRFDADHLRSLKSHGTLSDTLEFVIKAHRLRPDERIYLEIASATKLVDLSSYRPYRLSLSDLLEVRRILSRLGRTLSRRNRRSVYVHHLYARCIRARRFSVLLIALPFRGSLRAAFELLLFILHRSLKRGA